MEIAREIKTEMKRLLELDFCTVERPQTMARDIPTITKLAKNVIHTLKNFWQLVSPKLPQLIS